MFVFAGFRLVFALIGCVDAPRRPLQFPVTTEPSPTELTLAGGALTLTRAEVVIADVRLEGAPQIARSFSLIPSAHAHPGHEFAGDIRAELLGTFTVDLLGSSTELGIADAYEGDVVSGSLQAVALTVQGSWDGTLPVDLTLPLDAPVAGIPLTTQLDADAPPAGFALTLDLAHALSFLTFEDTNGDGSLTLTDGSTANTAAFGALSTPTWNLTEIP